MGAEFQVRKTKGSGGGWWRWWHDNLNVLTATKVYILKRLRESILCYIFLTHTHTKSVYLNP